MTHEFDSMILWRDYARPRFRQHRYRLRLVPRRSRFARILAWWQRRDPILTAVVLTAAAVVAGEWLVYWLVWR